MDILLLDVMQAGMGGLLIKVLFNAAALFVAAYFLKGVEIKSFTQALIAALVMAVLNSTLGGFLDFVTMPLRLLTLGLFAFVIDAVILLIAAYLLNGFKIESFWSAFIMAILVSVFNAILHGIYAF
ncbi:MAG: phage holin family protein [Saprospiraceae bacterium]|nr:phage holin family protein [Saprospiraceae bacterium]